MLRCGDGGQVADGHAQRREDPHDTGPVDRQRAERVREHAREAGEGGGLHAHRHERGDGGRRALVDVGRPRVERDRGDLEPEADQQQRDGGERQRALLDGEMRELRGDRVEQRRAEGAVGHGDAEEEEARGEGAEQEVLQRGFRRAQVGPPDAGEHVDRDRHELEAQEEDDEVVGLRHHDHAEQGEQEHDVVLAALDADRFQVVHRHQQREDADDADHDGEEHREPVEHEAAAESAAVGGPEQRGGDRGGAEAEHAEPAETLAVGAFHEQVGDEHDHRGCRDDDAGQQREPGNVHCGHDSATSAADAGRPR